ncbi:peptide ABC transporter substrate-binding protein [Vibrio sp.]|nr:peptide ABC transporter substrate-binding protein [Vibrio sp.]
MSFLKPTLISVALLASLSGSAFAAEVPAGISLSDQQTLVRGNGSEVPTLDPIMASDTASARVINDMFEGLMTEDTHGNVIPALATNWTESEDKKTYTFTLRDAKWSDGTTIKASDFVYALQRIVDPKTGAPYSWYVTMTNIVNASEITNGKTKPDSLGIKALDDKTVEFTLSKATPHFMKMLTHYSMFPIPQHVVEKYDTAWTKPENIVTSSAFTLDSWVINERIVLKRNKGYWNDNKTVINQVTYLPIEDVNAEYNRFRTNEIDVTSTVPLELYKTIKKNTPESLLTMPSLGTYYYLFNINEAPFDNPKVRKALAYTIDRDVVVNGILGQGQIPAYTNTPPAVAGFDVPELEWAALSQQERNEKAKALLAEAGYNEKNPLSFELDYNTSESHKKLAIAMASMWKKNLGATVNLANQEWKTFLQTLSRKEFDVARYAWIGDYNEASTFLSYFDSEGLNYGGWSNKNYDQLLDQASFAANDAEREKLYQKAEQIFAEDMPAIPVYFYTRSVLKQAKVGGYATDNASDNRYTRDLYMIK